MATYLEFHLKGGGCGIFDTSMIAGAIAEGHDTFARGVKDSPTLVVLKGGEHIEVIGEGPAHILARIVNIRRAYSEARLVDPRLDVLVDWLTPMEAVDEPAGA